MKIFSANTNIKVVSECCLVIVFLLLPVATAYANVDFNTLLSALQANLEPVILLTKAVGFVLGFSMVISAIIDLKKIGQSQSGAEGAVGGPLFRLALGIALIYYPFTISVGVATFTGTSSIQAYPISGSGTFLPAKQGALKLIQAVGYVSFIRGFVTLSHSAKPGAQQGSVGKGIVYVIGGILAINIVATMQIIGNSLGISMF
ncbi:intracellular multiplication protein IcmC [Gammaproteobacteria bacterium]